MPGEKMNVHEAQKQARQMVRFFKAFQHLAGVLDTVVDAEDRISMADLHVENARNELTFLGDRKAELQEENLTLEAVQEDLHRKGKTLWETYVSYKKQTEGDTAALDGHLEDHTDKYNEAIKSMETRKAELVDELRALRSEKEQIEGVIEAFRKANATQTGDKK